jgi:hypothetical protein
VFSRAASPSIISSARAQALLVCVYYKSLQGLWRDAVKIFRDGETQDARDLCIYENASSSACVYILYYTHFLYGISHQENVKFLLLSARPRIIIHTSRRAPIKTFINAIFIVVGHFRDKRDASRYSQCTALFCCAPVNEYNCE